MAAAYLSEYNSKASHSQPNRLWCLLADSAPLDSQQQESCAHDLESGAPEPVLVAVGVGHVEYFHWSLDLGLSGCPQPSFHCIGSLVIGLGIGSVVLHQLRLTHSMFGEAIRALLNQISLIRLRYTLMILVDGEVRVLVLVDLG